MRVRLLQANINLDNDDFWSDVHNMKKTENEQDLNQSFEVDMEREEKLELIKIYHK